jgi:branched-subunit amino acid aminotransferase/4-amino-4-deoxychorismate lyase
MAHGTHDFEDDARNERILIWVNGELVPRERAVVSVFDAGFILGDGVWEGLRVRAGHPAFLERHLDRLFEGAKAIMLDPHGFVATCNSTHFFIVAGSADAPEVLTSDGRYCLAGITRANVLEICRANGIPARETTFTLTDVYAAREAFVTGTFAGVVPVRSVDGRTIGDGRRGPMVERLQALYRELVDADVATRVAP